MIPSEIEDVLPGDLIALLHPFLVDDIGNQKKILGLVVDVPLESHDVTVMWSSGSVEYVSKFVLGGVRRLGRADDV